LPAGRFGRSSLSCALSRFRACRCLGFARRLQPCLFLSHPFPLLCLFLAALLVALTLLFALAFQLLALLLQLLGLALLFGALEGQLGLLESLLLGVGIDLWLARRRFDRGLDGRFDRRCALGWRRRRQADQLGLHHLGGDRHFQRWRPAAEQQREQSGVHPEGQQCSPGRTDPLSRDNFAAMRGGRAEGHHHGCPTPAGASVISPRLTTPPRCSSAIPATTRP